MLSCATKEDQKDTLYTILVIAKLNFLDEFNRNRELSFLISHQTSIQPYVLHVIKNKCAIKYDKVFTNRT